MPAVKFSDITGTDELISYLKETQRFNNIGSFSKYMRLSSVVNMFSSEMMLINNPAKMNDLYEYQAFNPVSVWQKICFASFITQSAESMAMWSMYAQPWSDGVMISIPASTLKELVQNTTSLISANFNEDNGRYSPGNDEIASADILSIIRVAYIDGNTITCTGRDDRNNHFANPYAFSELAGYIKDAAWDYEKEVRLRVDLPETYTTNAVYLKLSETFLKQITITTGPRFAGNVLTALPEKYRPLVNIRTSKFTEKLAWIPCDDCNNR